MDYLIEFEDGSDGCLSHHGVLGMKWGVRNAETLKRYSKDGKVSAKGLQKAMNRTDDRMRGAAIGMANSAASYQYITKKQNRAKAKGDTKKVDALESQKKIAQAHYEAYARDYVDAGKVQVENLKQIKANGYLWTSTPTNFMGSRQMMKGKDVAKAYGKLEMGSQYIVSNAASGNRIKVMDESKMSNRKKKKLQDKWAGQDPHEYRRHRPQVVYYY